ncbi:MAG: hypothetical protein J6B74_08915 [Ruminococcus sp.]|nr:hypothetical protein [Ruminococcus sp.]
MSEKSKKFIAVIFKILLIILAFVWSFFMVSMTGAGLIFNRESYGSYIMQTGVLFIVSGVLMFSGTVLCLFRKRVTNIISVIFLFTGFVLCMAMLSRLVDHADRNGWGYNFIPVSDMYRRRITPVIVPCFLSVVNAMRNCFSRK